MSNISLGTKKCYDHFVYILEREKKPGDGEKNINFGSSKYLDLFKVFMHFPGK